MATHEEYAAEVLSEAIEEMERRAEGYPATDAINSAYRDAAQYLRNLQTAELTS